MVAVAQSNGQVLVTNGAAPCEGTKAYPFQLDFTAGNAYGIDLTQQYNQKQFTTLQTAYVDNSLNTDPLEIVCGVTGQVSTCPALSQGFFSLLQPTPPKFTVQTDGNLVVTVIFLNFYIPPEVWAVPATSASGLPEVDVPALDSVISSGKVNVNIVPNAIQGLTDASGTITAGGASQNVVPANAATERFTIANPDTATETLYMHFGAAGAGPIPILPGGSWDENGTTIVAEGVWLSAATTGHAFTAYYK